MNIEPMSAMPSTRRCSSCRMHEPMFASSAPVLMMMEQYPPLCKLLLDGEGVVDMVHDTDIDQKNSNHLR